MPMTAADQNAEKSEVQIEVLKAMHFGGQRVEPGAVVAVSRYLAAELIHLQRAKLAD